MKTFNQYLKHQQLVEAIEADNDTGFRSEDLARIVEQHESGEWSEPMTGEQVIAWLNEAVEEEKNARSK